MIPKNQKGFDGSIKGAAAPMRVVKRVVVIRQVFLSLNAGRAERNGVERSRAR
jgi:hypothetical protein